MLFAMTVRPASPAELESALAATGYLADDGLATVAWLAMSMGRPLLLEGEPGTGKTALAEALAQGLDAELVRLQCYEGIDAAQALYDWDFPRQVLHLRAVEAARRRDGDLDVTAVESPLFDERFLLERPVLRALRSSNAVLLVDEIDRADDEFEAFLLEVLSTNAVTIPEYGTVRAEHPPLVVLTSNRPREVHDALKRRCLYHWVEHPGLAREVEILRTRLPGLPGRLAEQVALATHRLRDGAGGPARPCSSPSSRVRCAVTWRCGRRARCPRTRTSSWWAVSASTRRPRAAGGARPDGGRGGRGAGPRRP